MLGFLPRGEGGKAIRQLLPRGKIGTGSRRLPRKLLHGVLNAIYPPKGVEKAKSEGVPVRWPALTVGIKNLHGRDK